MGDRWKVRLAARAGRSRNAHTGRSKSLTRAGKKLADGFASSPVTQSAPFSVTQTAEGLIATTALMASYDAGRRRHPPH